MEKMLKDIIARKNYKYLILVFYGLCIAVFFVAFSYRQNVPIAFRTAGSIGAMVSASGLMLWVMALMLHWKTFWVFFITHSMFVLFLLLGSYWIYAYSIGATRSFLNASIVDFRGYLKISSLGAGLSIVRFTMAREVDA